MIPSKNKSHARKTASGRMPPLLLTANQLQEFVRDGCPPSWLEYAEELRDAAELIWTQEQGSLRLHVQLSAKKRVLSKKETSPVSRPYLLLAGFALENLLKGLLILKEPKHITSGALSHELKTHDLLALSAQILGLRLSRKEESLCKQMTQAIPYWGRYPIPLKQQQVMPSLAVNENTRTVFLELFDRLAHELYWAVRDGWDSRIGVATIKMRSLRYGDKIDPKEQLFEQ